MKADAKREYNRSLFTIVAPKYDFVTRGLSFFRDAAWKRALVAALPVPTASPGSRQVLDLACGTGDICELLADRYPSYSVVGLDLTPAMLVRARRRRVRRKITFVSASMDAIPYPNDAFTVVTGGYALRNAPDLDETLREILRVLEPGGTAAFLEFSRSPIPFFWALEYRLLRWWGGFWGVILHRDPSVYAYIARSLAAFPNRRRLSEKLHEHGFISVRSTLKMLGILAITTFEKPRADR